MIHLNHVFGTFIEPIFKCLWVPSLVSFWHLFLMIMLVLVFCYFLEALPVSAALHSLVVRSFSRKKPAASNLCHICLLWALCLIILILVSSLIIDFLSHHQMVAHIQNGLYDLSGHTSNQQSSNHRFDLH